MWCFQFYPHYWNIGQKDKLTRKKKLKQEAREEKAQVFQSAVDIWDKISSPFTKTQSCALIHWRLHELTSNGGY